MKRHTRCLLCGNERLRTLTGYEATHLCQCEGCGFVFAQAIPSKEELDEHYKKYGRNDYLSPVTVKRYHELLDELEKFRSTNRLIDVGCGVGYFLDEAKKRGWDVHGTEFTDEAVEICEAKGITMQKGPLDPDRYAPGSFDVITSFEVIEHINDPVDELRRFQRLLRPGGVVYCTTPNFNSLLRYRLGSAYNVITYPDHLCYYTPRTLKRVFRSCGFTPSRTEATGISLTRLRTSKGTSDQAFISATSDDEKMRNMIERGRALQVVKKTVNRALTVTGVGDTLKGWFVKR